MEEALPVGSRILDGQYCLTRLLYQRPRINLYLGRRLTRTAQREPWAAGATGETRKREDEPLVAIRELVLTGLDAEARAFVERAVREEFVSPGVVSSLHLSGTGERMWLRSQHERNYLLMQLDMGHEAHNPRHTPTIVTLADMLQQQQWPKWLDTPTAVAWGIQLCRIVARLHRLGTVLGDLDPATVLVNLHGTAPWLPLLFVSWPPSPQFWPNEGGPGRPPLANGLLGFASNYGNVMQHFPVLLPTFESAFAAPELVTGVYDGRADVYALGSILYLLLTGYAPASALRRLADGYEHGQVDDKSITVGRNGGALELIPPRLLRPQIAATLENILLRSLALDPAERYPAVFALIEALEAAQERQEIAYVARKASRWIF